MSKTRNLSGAVLRTAKAMQGRNMSGRHQRRALDKLKKAQAKNGRV